MLQAAVVVNALSFPEIKVTQKLKNLARPLLLTSSITTLQVCKRGKLFLATALTHSQGFENRLSAFPTADATSYCSYMPVA